MKNILLFNSLAVVYLLFFCASITYSSQSKNPGVTSVCFSSDSRFIAAALQSNAIYIWQESKNQPWSLVAILQVNIIGQDSITAICFLPSDRSLIVGTAEGRLIFLNEVDGHYTMQGPYKVDKMPTGIKKIFYNDKETILYLQSRSNEGLIFVKTQGSLEKKDFYESSGAFAVNVLGDGYYNLSIGKEGGTTVIEKKMNDSIHDLQQLSVGPVIGNIYIHPIITTLSVKGDFLAGADLHTIFVWQHNQSKSNFTYLASINIPMTIKNISNLLFNQDADRIAITCICQTAEKIALWVKNKNKWKIEKRIKYNAQPIANTLTFSPHNKYLACAFDNRTLRLEKIVGTDNPELSAHFASSKNEHIVLNVNDSSKENQSLVQVVGKVTQQSTVMPKKEDPQSLKTEPQREQPIYTEEQRGREQLTSGHELESHQQKPEQQSTIQRSPELEKSKITMSRERKSQKKFSELKFNIVKKEFDAKTKDDQVIKTNVKKMEEQKSTAMPKRTWGEWLKQNLRFYKILQKIKRPH